MTIHIQSSCYELFGVKLSYYLTLPIAGTLAAAAVAGLFAKRKNADASKAFRLVFAVYFLAAVTQALLTRLPDIAVTFAVFSMMLFVPALLFFAAKLFDCDGATLAGAGVISNMIYLGASKLGCFMAGCCHGRTYSGFMSVTYGADTLCNVKDTPLFPAQLVTALLLFAFAAMAFVILSKTDRKIYIVTLAFMGSFVYYIDMQLVDESCNRMIVGETDLSIYLAAASLAGLAASLVAAIKSRRGSREE